MERAPPVPPDTRVPCPKCGGKGWIMIALHAKRRDPKTGELVGYRREDCGVCECGTVTVAQARAWKSANLGKLRP